MRGHTLIWNILAAAALLMALTSGISAQSAEPTMQERVVANVNTFLKLWQAADAEGLSNLFAEDGVRVISSQQLPAVGRAAIRKTFEDTFAEGSPFAGATLAAKVHRVLPLSDTIVIGDGTWVLSDKAGAVVLKGKWGNAFRATGSELHLVMESAHADIDLSKDRSWYATAHRETPAPANYGNAEKLLGAFQRSADRYIAAVRMQSAGALAAEFTADGVRVVSSLPAASRGKAAIAKTARAEFAKGSPFEQATLGVTILGLRSLAPGILIGNGLWEAKGPDGGVVEFGQWGNVMKVQNDGEIKFIMESAGGYVGPEQSEAK